MQQKEKDKNQMVLGVNSVSQILLLKAFSSENNKTKPPVRYESAFNSRSGDIGRSITAV